MRIGATTFVSSCARASASLMSSTAPDCAKPALFTTAHGPPSVSPATSCREVRQLSSSSTSIWMVRTLTPRSAAARSTTSALPALRTVPITS